MNIIDKYITNTNNYSTKYNSHKYIVIHETDNTDKGANALAHYKNLQNNNCSMVGAHYFVDDNYIYHVVRDEHTIYHTGKKYSNKINRPEVNNSNSIGIEICVNSDGNYSNAVFNAKELVIFLMKKYNIPYTNVVRHYDSAGKQCPSTMLKKPSI